MLLSLPSHHWSFYEHAEGEIEVSFSAAHSDVFGGSRVVGIQLEASDGRKIGLRMTQKEARALVLHLNNVDPSTWSVDREGSH